MKYLKIIGIFIFLIILSRLDLSQTLRIVSHSHKFLLLSALLLILPFVCMKTLRWQYLLKMQGIHYNFKSSFIAYLGAMFIATITPGRLGDMVKVIYLKNDQNISMAKGITSTLLDRLLDLLILLTLTCSGIFFYSVSDQMMTISLVTICIFVITTFLFFHEASSKKLLNLLFQSPLLKKFRNNLTVGFSDFAEGVAQLRDFRLIVPILLSVLAYFILFSQAFLIAKSLAIPIDFLNVTMCMAIANVVALIPISVTGIGTRELALISLFSILNLSKESAVALSVLFLFLSNISSGFIGFVCWMIKPISLAKAKEPASVEKMKEENI